MATKTSRLAFAGIAVATFFTLASPAFGQSPLAGTDVLYVSNFMDDTVSVINRSTNAVIDTFALSPGAGPVAMVASPNGADLYVVQTFSNSVAKIDPHRGTLRGLIPTGSVPMGAAINQDGTRLYVTNLGSSSITIIDTVSASVAGTINLPSGISFFASFPVGISFTPDFTELWVVSQFAGRIDIIDPATDQVVDTIPLPFTAPVDIGFSSDGSLAYVAGHKWARMGLPDALCTIDTASRALLGQVLGSSEPNLGVKVAAVVAANGAAYVSNVGPVDTNYQPVAPFSSTITKVDLAGNATRIPTGGLSPAGMSVSADGLYLYVSNASSGTVGVIDTTTDALVTTIPVGTFPGFSLSYVRPGWLVIAEIHLNELIQANPNTDISDKAEDARAQVQAAIDKLSSTPPDRQAAMGEITGAVGTVEAALNDGVFDALTGANLLSDLVNAARWLATEAIDEAIARGGDPVEIAQAQEKFDEGEALVIAGQCKDAVAKFKDAVAKAETA